MRTPARKLRLDDKTWATLVQLSDILVPDTNRHRKATKKTSKVAPMLRLIATGKLQVMPTQNGGDKL